MSWFSKFTRRWLSPSYQPRASNASNFVLADQSYWVLDTETTGFDLHQDRILSIGMVQIKRGRILMSTSSEVIIAGNAVLKNSPTIHGLTLEELNQGVSENEALKQWLEKIHPSDILVAHYATFDRGILYQAFERHGLTFPENIWLDTMDIQIALEPERAENAPLLTLDTLLLYYGIEGTKRHTALGDAYATARVLQHQLAQCHQRGWTNNSSIRPRRTGLLG